MVKDEKMEHGRKRNAAFGLLMTLLILGAVVAGVFFLAKWQSRGVDYTIRFADAQNLTVGNKVVLSGVPVGEVRNVRLVKEGEILVDVRLDDAHANKIKKDSTAIITTPDMINVSGQKIVEIYNPSSGSDETIAEGSTIEGKNGLVALKAWEVKNSLKDVSANVSEGAADFKEKMGTWAEEMKDIPESPEVKAALEKMDKMAKDLKEKGKDGWAKVGEEWGQFEKEYGPRMTDWKEIAKQKASGAWSATKEKISEAAGMVKDSLATDTAKTTETAGRIDPVTN